MTETIREVLDTGADVAARAAALIVEAIDRAEGPARIALSGGSTPKRLFELLATPIWRDRIQWPRVHWFWGDERFVPPDHPDSNYRMARLAFLAAVPAPADHVHPVPTVDLTPEQAAERYAQTLAAHAPSDGRPFFDINLLGMGDDGHTASLFPGNPALDETGRSVVAVIGAKPEPRITLTYPMLNDAARVLFLVVGAAKRPALARIAAGEPLPASRIKPTGVAHWLLDRDAAA